AGTTLTFGFDIDCTPAELPAVVRFRATAPPAANCTEVAPDPLPFTEGVAVWAPSAKKAPANPFWNTFGGMGNPVTRALAGTLTSGDEIVTTGFSQNAGGVEMYLSLADIDGGVLWS